MHGGNLVQKMKNKSYAKEKVPSTLYKIYFLYKLLNLIKKVQRILYNPLHGKGVPLELFLALFSDIFFQVR